MRIPALLCVAWTLAACTTQAQYVSATSKFSEAVLPATEAYRGFVTRAYTTQADSHMRQAEIDPSKPLDPLTLAETRSFSEQSLLARIEAMDALVLYGRALAAASATDVGADFKAKALAAGSSFDSALATARQLAGDGNEAKALAGPISAIVGVIGEAVIRDKQAQEIRQAILTAGPSTSKLIAAMRHDLSVGSLIKGADRRKLLSLAASSYNGRLGTKGFEGKVQEAALAKVAEEYAGLTADQTTTRKVGDLLEALERANGKLIAYAQSPSGDDRLKALDDALVAIQDLTLRAELIVAELKKVRRAL